MQTYSCTFTTNLKKLAQRNVEDFLVYDIEKHSDATKQITEGIIQSSKKGKTNLNIYDRGAKTQKADDQNILRIEVQCKKKLLKNEYNEYGISKPFAQGFLEGTTICLPKDTHFTLEEVYNSLYSWLYSQGFEKEDIKKIVHETEGKADYYVVCVNWKSTKKN